MLSSFKFECGALDQLMIISKFKLMVASIDFNKHWNKIWKGRVLGDVNPFALEVDKVVPPKSKILDLGCGLGVDSLYYASQGHEVVATDVSEHGVARLNEKIAELELNNIKARVMDSTQIDFEPGSFDVVYSHLSLHYFDDETTQKIVDKIFEILKPGGFFGIKCKSVKDPLYGKGVKIDNDTFDNDGHIRHFFSSEYMQSKLERAGFVDIKIKEASGKYHGFESAFIEAIAHKA